MIVLYQWCPDFNCPTMDPICLSIHTYLRCAGIDYRTHNCNNPKASPDGTLPFIVIQDDNGIELETKSGFTQIIAYLKKLNPNFDLDKSLNTYQSSLLVVLTDYMLRSLGDGWDYSLWFDQENYNTTTSISYSKALGFPLNILFLWSIKQQISSRFNVTHQGDLIRNPTQIFSKVKECLQSVSEILGDSKYLFGDQVSSLDCLFFGFIQLIFSMPLPNDDLHQIASEFWNLKDWHNNMISNYYSLEKPQMAKILQNPNKKHPTDHEKYPVNDPQQTRTPEEEKQYHQNLTIGISGLVVFAFFAAYKAGYLEETGFWDNRFDE